MPLGWIKGLPMAALLLSAAVTLSSCNTVSGTIGGVGRDISMIGNTLSSVSGSCRHERCAKRSHRQGRRVVSECGSSRSCGRGYRSPRYERASYRERYAYRDRYGAHRSRCC
ncbi:MAG: hypothetical protein AAGA21_20645 [Pseudomonadota bacterium]